MECEVFLFSVAEVSAEAGKFLLVVTSDFFSSACEFSVSAGLSAVVVTVVVSVISAEEFQELIK